MREAITWEGHNENKLMLAFFLETFYNDIFLF